MQSKIKLHWISPHLIWNLGDLVCLIQILLFTRGIIFIFKWLFCPLRNWPLKINACLVKDLILTASHRSSFPCLSPLPTCSSSNCSEFSPTRYWKGSLLSSPPWLRLLPLVPQGRSIWSLFLMLPFSWCFPLLCLHMGPAFYSVFVFFLWPFTGLWRKNIQEDSDISVRVPTMGSISPPLAFSNMPIILPKFSCFYLVVPLPSKFVLSFLPKAHISLYFNLSTLMGLNKAVSLKLVQIVFTMSLGRKFLPVLCPKAKPKVEKYNLKKMPSSD